MRNYWIETLLIAVLFVLAFNVSLAHAQGEDGDGDAVPDYVYGTDSAGVDQNANSNTGDGDSNAVPDYVYGDQGGENLNIAVTTRGSEIQVQPLDSPTNPYRGQYNDIDRQVYGSIDSEFTRGQVSTSAQAGPTVLNRNLYNDPVAGSTRVPVMVDENGFMIPTTSPRYLTPQYVQTAPGEYTVADADLHDNILGDAPASDPGATVTPGSVSNERVAVKGVSATRDGLAFTYTIPLEQARYDAFRAAQIEAAAGMLPSIPNWVEQLHPTSFSLLPNGGALVTGLKGKATNTVTIYSPEGKTVGVLPMGADATRYFVKNYDAIQANAIARGLDLSSRDGYILLQSRTTGKVEVAYDWDGTELSAQVELAPRPFYFTPLRWDSLVEVSKAQRRVPAAGRKPQAQQTVGSGQVDNSPAPDSDVNSGK
ncbi:MAG: hypothetical protein M3R04_04695 [bacterium]|nr:hypothetical protein [bacterium]